MNWTDLLKSEAESTYRAVEGLMDLVDADKLDWKPEPGDWMTTAELLRHVTNACGWCCERFVTDTWQAVMEGTAPSPGTTVESVDEAKRLLAERPHRRIPGRRHASFVQGLLSGLLDQAEGECPVLGEQPLRLLNTLHVGTR